MSEGAVRDAFRSQERWCEQLGSPFTARLSAAFARGLDRETAIGRRILDWPGEPDALHDSVPLRIAGGLHALVRRGRLPDLAALYPPNPLPQHDRLWAAVRRALAEAEDDLLPWLDSPPQTNEVARSAVLMAGLAVVAAETRLPLALLELGASAGLNLLCDRYAVRLGSRTYGDPSSPVVLQPKWRGAEPPEADIRVVGRRGVDIAPLDVTSPRDRERLLAYVWPDQADRLARLEAALELAAADPPRPDRGDAADWLDRELAGAGEPGLCRVVLHSIAFQYFPPATQARIAARMDAAGSAAGPDRPLAWLRYEADGAEGGRPGLRLRLWPDGTDRLLARPDPHGRSIEWLG